MEKDTHAPGMGSRRTLCGKLMEEHVPGISWSYVTCVECLGRKRPTKVLEKQDGYKMKTVKLLLPDNPSRDLSGGTEVTFLVDDFTDQHQEDVFFHNLRSLVRPNVRIFDAPVSIETHFVRGKFQEIGNHPEKGDR